MMKDARGGDKTLQRVLAGVVRTVPAPVATTDRTGQAGTKQRLGRRPVQHLDAASSRNIWPQRLAAA
jgi:hypothetical protein